MYSLTFDLSEKNNYFIFILERCLLHLKILGCSFCTLKTERYFLLFITKYQSSDPYYTICSFLIDYFKIFLFIADF